MEKCYVFFSVRTECFNIISMSFGLQRVNGRIFIAMNYFSIMRNCNGRTGENRNNDLVIIVDIDLRCSIISIVTQLC
jgi:hypothetical protein